MKPETAAQRCARIIAALEDLIAQESAALHGRDFSAIDALQERTAPLVDFLAEHREVAQTDDALRNRIASLHARRQRNAEWLEAELGRTRAELNQTQVARRRAAQIAPVYGRSATAPRSQLSVRG